MSDLSTLQHDFMNYLLTGEEIEHVGAHKDRISIYRNNLMLGVKDYLGDTFGTVKKVVGEKFFNAMSQRYIEAQLPPSGNLHEYGATFSQFILEFEPAKSLSYLPQIAALEWARHCCYYAVEPASLDINQLMAEGGEAALLSAQVRLKPSVHLLSSDYPIDQIWAQSQDDFEGEFNVDLHSGGCQLLLFRHEWKVQLWRVDNAAWQLLQQLYFQDSGTNSLESALTEAMQLADPETVQSFLSELFTHQILTQPNK